ncbi:MAG TPA: hypothetical protein VND64_32785 [Pirellulales bacterium]|nr:hypothetical protein [Pirellulales bacterium]
MARAANPRFLQAWLAALTEGQRFAGYVIWKSGARQWVNEHLEGYRLDEVEWLLYQHVAGGGTLEQVEERREAWMDCKYHFDVRFEIEGTMIYFETVLLRDDPEDPLISIVSVHLV